MAKAEILLVDDDRLVLTTLGIGLRRAGYSVSEASSGEAALAMARQTRFDIAILDIGMPDISGTELAGQLLADHDLPAMFLSAYVAEDTVDEAVAKGGLGYLVKPIDVPQLIPALESALARARDLQALIKLKGQLEHALGSGRDTSTAVGIVMERHGLGRQAAFDTLRRTARGRGIRLEALAGELIAAAETLSAVGPSCKK
jgi:response regulator NasT